MYRIPAHLTAGSRELLDRFPERPRLGANSAVLHVDDEECRPFSDASSATKSGSTICFPLTLRDDGVPGIHADVPSFLSFTIARFKRVVVVLGDGALAFLERGETVADLIERAIDF